MQIQRRPIHYDTQCVICGKPRPSKTAGRWNTRTACPGKCEQARRSTIKERPCATCGSLFRPGQRQPKKYCSRKCYTAAVGVRPAMVSVACIQCGAMFRRTAAAVKRRERHFCSRACVALGNRGEGSALYRGDNDPNRGGDWRRLAEAIRDRDGRKCRRCGTTEVDNRAKLSVDHTRPWRTFENKAEANDPSNLVSLCKACHSRKTVTVERAYLRGDRVEFMRWLREIAIDESTSARRTG